MEKLIVEVMDHDESQLNRWGSEKGNLLLGSKMVEHGWPGIVSKVKRVHVRKLLCRSFVKKAYF